MIEEWDKMLVEFDVEVVKMEVVKVVKKVESKKLVEVEVKREEVFVAAMDEMELSDVDIDDEFDDVFEFDVWKFCEFECLKMDRI